MRKVPLAAMTLALLVSMPARADASELALRKLFENCSGGDGGPAADLACESAEKQAYEALAAALTAVRKAAVQLDMLSAEPRSPPFMAEEFEREQAAWEAWESCSYYTRRNLFGTYGRDVLFRVCNLQEIRDRTRQLKELLDNMGD